MFASGSDSGPIRIRISWIDLFLHIQKNFKWEIFAEYVGAALETLSDCHFCKIEEYREIWLLWKPNFVVCYKTGTRRTNAKRVQCFCLIADDIKRSSVTYSSIGLMDLEGIECWRVVRPRLRSVNGNPIAAVKKNYFVWQENSINAAFLRICRTFSPPYVPSVFRTGVGRPEKSLQALNSRHCGRGGQNRGWIVPRFSTTLWGD